MHASSPVSITVEWNDLLEKKNMFNFVAAVKYFLGAKRWTVKNLKSQKKMQ